MYLPNLTGPGFVTVIAEVAVFPGARRTQDVADKFVKVWVAEVGGDDPLDKVVSAGLEVAVL